MKPNESARPSTRMRVQVAWQSLVEAGEGSVMDDSGAGKASTVGVVLTPGRALLVTVTLLPLATASADRAGSPFTSCLWLGPALLLSTASHQVVQMAWDGSLVRVCSLGGGPPSVLGGALAERLLVVRGGAGAGPGGQAEVSQRHVPLLGPLLAGWASLAASNILPGGLWRARQEMGQLLRSYDASGIDQELIKALTSAGCADVAAILAATDSASQVEPQLKTAVQAAAGQWRDAVTAAAAQHRASIFHPKPWPKGSQQAQRLIALGRAALAYGHVSAAQELWGLAGNWAELLPLAALQADFGTVRRLSAQAQGNPQARNIASALIAGSEPRIKRAAAVGARALPGDWRVEIETDLPDVVPLAGAAMLAPPGAAPSMEAAAGLGVNEAPASIPQMDSVLLQAYLGVGQGNVRGAVLQAPAQREATEEEEAAFAAPAPTEEEDGSLEGTEDKSEAGTSTSAAAAANDPQAAARAAFMDAMPAEAGSSDDEGQDKSTRAGNLQPAASDASFTSTSTGVGQTQRFKVVIRDRAEASAADPGNDALRAAAQGLKLAPLIPLPSPRASGPLPPAKAAAKKPAFAFKAQADSSSDEESGSQTNRRAAAPPGLPRTSAQAKQPPAASAQPPVFDPFPEGFAAPPTLQLAPAPAVAGSSQAPREIPEDLFTATPKKADAQTSALAPSLPSTSAGPSRMAPPPAQPAAVARPSAPARAPAAAAPPGPSLAAASPAMKAGMAAMEAGSWQRAAAELGSALSQARAGSPEGAQAAQYLAAVLLLQECGKAEKVTGARLTRYAAALPLDLSHRRALVQSAIARNMDVANYEYAVEQLTWLVVQSTGTASPAYLASLQQRIEQCDRAGGRNARLPDDEDTSSLADIVASASSSADINDCIRALLA